MAGAALPIRRGSRPPAFRKSPWCTARRPPAAPICRDSRITWCWCAGGSSIYLAGPPLVKAAIGEDATDEALGGAEMHATVTGLGEYLCENDAHAIALARELMDKLQLGRRARASADVRAAAVRRGRVARHRARRRARALRCARSHRAHRRRFRLPRVQGALRVGYGLRPCPHRGSPGRHPRQQRPDPARPARSRRRSSSSSATRAARRWSFCRTPPATWSVRRPSVPARSSTARR